MKPENKQTVISKHIIGTSGYPNIIAWTAGAQHRYYPTFDVAEQLEYAKKIARVEDSDARKLMLDLLDAATRGTNRIAEARKEFETINTALVKIDTQLQEETVAEPARSAAQDLRDALA